MPFRGNRFHEDKTATNIWWNPPQCCKKVSGRLFPCRKGGEDYWFILICSGKIYLQPGRWLAKHLWAAWNSARQPRDFRCWTAWVGLRSFASLKILAIQNINGIFQLHQWLHHDHDVLMVKPSDCKPMIFRLGNVHLLRNCLTSPNWNKMVDAELSSHQSHSVRLGPKVDCTVLWFFLLVTLL